MSLVSSQFSKSLNGIEVFKAMRKLTTCVIALTFVVALSNAVVPAQFKQIVSEKSVASDPTEPAAYSQESDIHGFFIIKGKAPKEFSDIDHLNLGGSGEYGAGAKPPYYGQIRLKIRARTDFKLLKPNMNGNNFSFKTKTVGGVSYEFGGTFSRLDFTEVDKQPAGEEVVLSGTLKKMKAGKMVAQSKVNFRWELGD
jgi:hypothetical protein